jgi:hypothetical protein
MTGTFKGYVLAATAGAVTVACGAGNLAPATADASDSGAGLSTGGASGAGCMDAVATGSPVLIDDLNDNNQLIPNSDGRKGGWFTYSDGTGMQTPTPAPPQVCDPNIVFQPASGRACTTGSGFTKWGAGLGVSIDAGANCKSCQYDATVFNGVRFTISGTVTGIVRFMVVIADTHGVQWGGTCADDAVCADNYCAEVPVSSGPQVVEVPWTNLRQRGWGTAVPLNLRQLHNLTWEVGFASGSTTASFQDLCVDDVAFF